MGLAFLKMKAIRICSANANVRLDDIAKPTPGPNEIRLEVNAAALNFADLLIINGTYQDTPEFPLTPGLEVAGIVDAIGERVSNRKIGDRVAVQIGSGGLAEYAVAPADRALELPETMSDAVAAGFQIAYGTSHLALLRRARLKAQETVVVLGAAGGVGLTAVEVAKAIGARVIAVARGRDRLKVAKSAGADIAIDSMESSDLRTDLMAHGPSHVIYDAVGGADADAAARALAPEGRHLLIGFASGHLPTLKPNHMMVKNVECIGVNWGAYLKFNPSAALASLQELLAWHANGRIRPHIGHTFRLDQTAEALELLKSRGSTGKIVIIP